MVLNILVIILIIFNVHMTRRVKDLKEDILELENIIKRMNVEK